METKNNVQVNRVHILRKYRICYLYWGSGSLARPVRPDTCMLNVLQDHNDDKSPGNECLAQYMFKLKVALPGLSVISMVIAFQQRHMKAVAFQFTTVKPVYNDHLYNKIYPPWFIQWCVLMKTEGTNLLLLTISALWSSRRQRSIPLGGRYRQVLL